MIRVEKESDTEFEVTVESTSTTTHKVTVPPAFAEKLTGGKTGPEELVRQSFEFLLEREPNTSILAAFELPVIGRYFPEYERVIRDRLHPGSPPGP